MTSRMVSVLGALVLGCGGSSAGDDGGGDGGHATEGIDAGTAADGDATAGEDTAGTGDGNDGNDGNDGESGSVDDDGSDDGYDDDDTALPFSCDGITTPDDPDVPGVMCFYDVDNPDGEPAASLKLSSVDLDGQPAVYVQLVFAPWFVDNTYGVESIGWDNTHEFDELVGSDHALIQMGDAGQDPLIEFKLDYIDEDDTATSGFRCQGVWDGNGKMEEGDEAVILAANSSLSRNLNERGYATYVVDSPATDADYTDNPATPDWDYRVVYEAWVDASLFADVDAIDACIDSIHASPAKIGDNTVEVIPDECPPGWGCFTNDDCDECSAGPSDPDSPSTCDPGDGYPPVP